MSQNERSGSSAAPLLAHNCRDGSGGEQNLVKGSDFFLVVSSTEPSAAEGSFYGGGGGRFSQAPPRLPLH